MKTELQEWEVCLVTNGAGARFFNKATGRIHKPVFANGRKDICVVKYQALMGNLVFEAIILVWKDSKEKIHYSRIDDIEKRLFKTCERDIIDVVDVNASNGCISVKVSSGGTLSGKKPWNRTIEIPMDKIDKLEC